MSGVLRSRGGPLDERLPEFVGRLAPLLQRMSSCVTSMSPLSARMNDASRSLPMACLSGVASNLPSTLHSSRRSLRRACHVVKEAARPGQLCVLQNVPKPELTQSWRPAADAGSSSSALRLAGAGAARPPCLSGCLLDAGPEPLRLRHGQRALPRLRCAGRHSSPLQPHVPLQSASFPFPSPAQQTLMENRLSSATSLLTRPSSPPLPVACRRYLWVVRGRGLLHWDREVDAEKRRERKKIQSN